MMGCKKKLKGVQCSEQPQGCKVFLICKIVKGQHYTILEKQRREGRRVAPVLLPV